MTLDEFIARASQRPLPTSPMARIRTLAKELAEGAIEEVWETPIVAQKDDLPGSERRRYVPLFESLQAYLAARWNNNYPDFTLLERNGYLERDVDTFEITQTAFQLVEEVLSASVFISYKRSESSALALLVLSRLKEKGIDAFVDLTIQPGDDWQDHLKKQIEHRDYVVLLLGRETLKSEVVLEEIQMALDKGLHIIPIWHNGFKYAPEEWVSLSPTVNRMLSTTHTVRVLEESALAYNNAIVELLNRFGVTP